LSLGDTDLALFGGKAILFFIDNVMR